MSPLAPSQKFRNELLSVIIRWTEESDISDELMEEVFLDVHERYFGTDIDFASDFSLDDD